MGPWKTALRDGAITGSLASLLSTAVLALVSRRETGSPFAATNAVSHWLWGGEALRTDRADWRHTALGYAVHHGASIFWGVLHSRFYGQREAAQRPGPAAAGAVAATAVACFVDYRLTPKRLTPGFEHRLSTPAMAAVYGGFAAGILLGALALRRHR